MPFEFKCRNCGNIISVTILESGEQAYCQKCHTINIVPDKNIEYNGIPVGKLPGDPKLHNPIPGASAEKKGVAIRSTTEVVGEAFNIYFTLIWKVLALSALTLLPAMALGFVFFQFIQNPTSDEYQIGMRILTLVIAYGVSAIFGILVAPLINGAIFYIVARHYVKINTGVIQALRVAIGKASKLIPASLLIYIATIVISFIPFIGFIIGLYIMIIWSLVICAIILENKDLIESFKRSKELVDGFWWSIFGSYAIIWLILFFAFLILIFVSVYMGFLTLLLFIPIFLIVCDVIYFNQRAIKEGYTNDKLREEILKLEDETARNKS